MMIKAIKKSLADLPPFKRVVIGVSGGVDSMALAHVLMALDFDITIVHLNHGLRGADSNKDAEFVAEFARKWNVPYVTKKIKMTNKGNLENQARILRYMFLEKIRREKNARFIAVGHHQNDQVETILMHLMRGAGLRGLCGMRLVNGKIIRPFLNVTKQDLIDYLKKEKIDYRTDKSNFDIRFRRNLLR
ncbi:tRNA lysidine(34) synthetase TilS, partial [candidate division KSB1 bacterium]